MARLQKDLEKDLTSGVHYAGMSAAHRLAKLKSPAAVDVLVAGLDKADYGGAIHIAHALGEIGDRRATAALVSLFDRPDALHIYDEAPEYMSLAGAAHWALAQITSEKKDRASVVAAVTAMNKGHISVTDERTLAAVRTAWRARLAAEEKGAAATASAPAESPAADTLFRRPEQEAPWWAPGSFISVQEAVRMPGARVVVAEALADGKTGPAGQEQAFTDSVPFKIVEWLAGSADADEATITFPVIYFTGQRERSVRKGERVIWIVRLRSAEGPGSKEPPEWQGVKLLADTPRNRRAVGVVPGADKTYSKADVATMDAACAADLVVAATIPTTVAVPGDLCSITETGTVVHVLKGDTKEKTLAISFPARPRPEDDKSLPAESTYIFFLGPGGSWAPALQAIEVVPDTPENRKAVEAAVTAAAGPFDEISNRNTKKGKWGDPVEGVRVMVVPDVRGRPLECRADAGLRGSVMNYDRQSLWAGPVPEPVAG